MNLSKNRTEIDEFVDKLETLHEAGAPNQIALELLKSAAHINDLVVITRDTTGKLHAVWSDQDLAEVTESALYLTAMVQHDLFLEHEGPPGEAEDDNSCDD